MDPGYNNDESNEKMVVYISTIIFFYLVIPDIFLRTLSPEQLGRLSDFTSPGGVLSLLLSLLIFLMLFSVLLAVIIVKTISRILRSRGSARSR